MATIEEYRAFFLASSRRVVLYDTIEISQPALVPIYMVRNAVKGITATTEDGETVDFEYVPMSFRGSDAKSDLDYAVTIQIGDVGEILPEQLDRIQNVGNWNRKPVVTYRVFRSDQLSEPLNVVKLQIDELRITREGVAFEAVAPYLNLSAVGLRYRIGRFPGLRDV